MSVNVFKLEDYLARYEFSAPYLLCCSDAETFSMAELLSFAGPEEMMLWDGLRLGYTEPKGMQFLRDEIAANIYSSLSGENILCFAGAEDGIFCALHELCEPGDHVIAFKPCYQSLMEIPTLRGAELTAISLREENQWKIDLAEVERAIRPNTKCIVINFPHNPTGQVISELELMELVKLCSKYDIWLFSDEVYRLLGNPEQGWAPNVTDIYHKGISVGVMSKAFGLPGLRVGWLACKDVEMLGRIEKLKHYTSICNSAPSEILSLIAIKNKDSILYRNNQIVQQNLSHLDQFFEQYSHLFSWVKPQGGCVGFVNYMGKENVSDFTDRLVRSKGVLLMPANIYDQQSNHFRIGFGRKNMIDSLNRFKEFLDESNQKNLGLKA